MTEQSVSIRATANGMEARERVERFKVEALTEVVLRAAGIVMVMGAIALWFLLPTYNTSGQIGAFSIFTSMVAASGLIVFAVGTRGFRRHMQLDVEKGTLSLTKINIHGQSRISRKIDLGAIQSVFLRRPATPGGMATLLVRVTGSNAPAIALSGETEEVQQVHEQLCAVMKVTQGKKPCVRLYDDQNATA